VLCISAGFVAAEPVNINSADKATLMAVKGVGERRAEAIIAWREKNGPFKSVDQLMEVEGIGQATLDANKDLLTVGSPAAQ
jgi:competence protein ComEA